jgi:hypothetical protein
MNHICLELTEVIYYSLFDEDLIFSRGDFYAQFNVFSFYGI